MSQILCCIPARYNSSRLPGKPLLKINNKTIIQLVYEKVLLTNVDDIIVLTDDKRIFQEVLSFNGNCKIISENCLNGTERIIKYLKTIDHKQYDIILNVQGDEPFINPYLIDKCIKNYNLHKNTCVCSTICYKTKDKNIIESKSKGKVVLDLNNNIVYCSRNVIPSGKKDTIIDSIEYYIHVGIFVFNKKYLLTNYIKSNTPNQLLEDIEWLKIIEQGYKINAFISDKIVERGIDTENDYKCLYNKYNKYINYVFPFGERCNSAHFLNKYKLRKIAYPLDWNRIDFDSCCYNISNNFNDFLNDIVVFKNKNIKLYYPKNYTNIKPEIINFFNNDKFGWNNKDYNNITFRINQNFLPTYTYNNIYKWDKLCFLWNYDITDLNIYNKIQQRIYRFNNIDKSNKLLFLHISKTVDILNKNKEISFYKKIINKYKLKHFFCIVICCGNIEKSFYENIDNILFIFLKVLSNDKQKEKNNYILKNNLYHTNDIYNNLGDFVHSEFYEIDHKYIYDVMMQFYCFNNLVNHKTSIDELKH